jgi:hypothetical protein
MGAAGPDNARESVPRRVVRVNPAHITQVLARRRGIG